MNSEGVELRQIRNETIKVIEVGANHVRLAGHALPGLLLHFRYPETHFSHESLPSESLNYRNCLIGNKLYFVFTLCLVSFLFVISQTKAGHRKSNLSLATLQARETLQDDPTERLPID